MTEKRFYLNKGEVDVLKIIDFKEDNEAIYRTTSESDMKIVVDLLNALHKENEGLKNRVIFLDEVITSGVKHTYFQKLYEENKRLKKELKRCKDWLNSDKNDYELTLAFIKNKGYSLKDVLEYEKELNK